MIQHARVGPVSDTIVVMREIVRVGFVEASMMAPISKIEVFTNQAAFPKSKCCVRSFSVKIHLWLVGFWNFGGARNIAIG